MKQKLFYATTLAVALGLSACSGGGGGDKGGGKTLDGTPDSVGLTGSWEAQYPGKTDASGATTIKGKVEFSGDAFTYTWYEKRVGPDNQVVYDWTETMRETGKASATEGYMQWTADSFGEAEYNEVAKSWGAVNMKSSQNDYAITFSKDGDKLTMKEDINVDGDFDDTFTAPETLVYTKVK
jgi:hypothetical protein